MPDRRGCSPQRPVDRLVTTPQTVLSFIARHRLSGATLLTLVTLDCRPFDITMSVSGGGGEVYPPRVLRLRCHGPFRVVVLDRYYDFRIIWQAVARPDTQPVSRALPVHP